MPNATAPHAKDNSLASRIALVTGASAGIGRAIALDLASRGASVVVNARRVERLEELVREIEKIPRRVPPRSSGDPLSPPLRGDPPPEGEGGRALAVPGDASDPAVIARMLDAARDQLGGGKREADLVVVNAGRGLAGSVVTSDQSQWEEMVRINVIGCAALIRAAAERMLRSGERLSTPRDIVVLGSNVGRHVSPFSSMYGSTKFAAGALAEGARRELGPKGIRVSHIAPGVVVSEFQKVAGYTDELVRGFDQKFGPLLTPDDIARLVGFITSQPAGVHVCDVVIRPTRQDYP